MSTNRFGRILQALVEHDVRFVIVGGVAAVLQRVPVTTMDLDIVHDRRPDNVDRLLAALAVLQATYRNDPRRLPPSASHLIGPGSQLLRVGVVDFDVIGCVDPGLGYDELVEATDVMDVLGYQVRVLKLEKLIELKRALPRPKDKLMLLYIEATLEERERGTRRG
ncbi:MAG: hypothetical protein JW940_14920 [Polyangiaceae bacterium]|nr:hypothetical protein [Polyangiaceae bacterium]